MRGRTGLLWAGAVMLVCWHSAPEAEARARTRMICEEWRDYYYNASTGEFLEWAGEPYWTCYYDEPVSQPGSPEPDLYGGGMGLPRDPHMQTCQQCEKEHEECSEGLRRGIDRCLDHYRQQARTWCIETRRKRFGRPIEGDYMCETVEDPRGKPRRVCRGPAIDDCVESFAQDQPQVSIENTDKINVGYDWWGVGSDRTSTVTWGGDRGFVRGCRLAYQEAGAVCLAKLSDCEEAAGGCR